MTNLITKGEAVAGKLTAATDVEAKDDLVAGDDLTVGDDAAITGDLTAGTLGVTGAITAGTLAVGTGGTVIKKVTSATASVDFPSIAAAETGSATFTLTGAAAGDMVVLNPPALTTGLVFAGAAVTGANTVTVYAVNATANPINEAAATFRYLWADLT